MAAHNDTGKQGEKLALEYLIKKGYEILHQNWRFRNWELDIIALNNRVVHVIEVRTRKCSMEYLPEKLVSKTKIRLLIDAGNEFMKLNPKYKLIQFDLLVVLVQGEKVTFLEVEDIYIW